ncbi:RNA polymerase sigma-70 factor [Chitinophaga lutea]|uniref:RNA polymerase sigma-70 factor n=1 Tax=Chitinophaga lutea TaxID=2488634 RepID=A0A3N4PZJ0_9BACT|nr:RNA polymerase sigma-70 factor [Chitinophaga lutea]RPE14223.1 RNA polymerase sigma-70 factor [Chitinophaga lutea]
MPAFRRLYELLAGDLLQYIRLFTGNRADAEEILQDVFVKLWEKRETLPDIRSFRSYLFKMGRNHVLNYLRSEKKWETLPAEDPVLIQPDPAEKAIIKEYYRIAQDAIDHLPERRKQVFRLREEDGLSLDEIASLLGISKSAVKQHLYAATAHIRKYLQQYGVSTVYLPLFCTYLYT